MSDTRILRSARRLAAAVLFFVGVSLVPAGASAALQVTQNVAGDTIKCGTTTYTITSGLIKGTFHFDETASGNTNFTGTLTPRKVTATSTKGGTFSIQGAFWFGDTFNAQRDSGQSTFTGKLQIVKKGAGTVDSVNITAHVSPSDKEIFLDLGSCAEPG